MALKGLLGLCCGVEKSLTFLLFALLPVVPLELAAYGFSSSESSTSWKSVGVSARFDDLNVLFKNFLKCRKRMFDQVIHKSTCRVAFDFPYALC